MWAAVDLVGVFPIHTHEKQIVKIDGSEVTFTKHGFGAIFKVVNTGGAEIPVSMALLDGCVKIGPFEADSGLPEEQRSKSGERFDAIVKARRDAVQRISMSGSLDGGSAGLAASAVSYVKVRFPFRTGGGALLGTPGSVSLDGSCRSLEVSNSQPSVFEVFDMETIQQMPKGLRQEFEGEKLRLSLFAGTRHLTVDPNKVRRLLSVGENSWKEMAVAEMYENPETSYPPRRVSERGARP